MGPDHRYQRRLDNASPVMEHLKRALAGDTSELGVRALRLILALENQPLWSPCGHGSNRGVYCDGCGAYVRGDSMS